MSSAFRPSQECIVVNMSHLAHWVFLVMEALRRSSHPLMTAVASSNQTFSLSHCAEQPFGSLHSLETRMARITMTGCSVSDGSAVADSVEGQVLERHYLLGAWVFHLWSNDTSCLGWSVSPIAPFCQRQGGTHPSQDV